MKKETDIYKESMRYIDNAKEILTTKAGKQGEYYNDQKYVRMACNTAYSGVLISLDTLFDHKGIVRPKKKNKIRDGIDVKFYRENLGFNQSILKAFNTAYNYLHLFGGYDGDLHFNTAKTGIDKAIEIIDWVRKQISK